jgi:hypothetical protein
MNKSLYANFNNKIKIKKKKKKKRYRVLSIDAKKAFDKIQYLFIIKVLRKLKKKKKKEKLCRGEFGNCYSVGGFAKQCAFKGNVLTQTMGTSVTKEF